MIVRGCARALVLLVLWCTGLPAGALAKAGAAGAAGAAQQSVFRANADLVTVPVSVRANGAHVGGLKAEDFVLLDNGVPQKIESLDNLGGEAMPADITILVETGMSMTAYQDSLSAQVQKISAMVRPGDRLEVLGIGTYIKELLPLNEASAQPPLGPLKTGGNLTSVNDALVGALLREPDKERPHLVIAITDTVDSMSMTDMTTVRDIAKQSGATLVIAWVTLSIEAVPDRASGDPLPGAPKWFTTSERDDVATSMTRSAPRARYWVPHHTPPAGRTIDAFDIMKEAAESTGGAMHPPGVFTDRSAAAIFEKIYGDYRHSYVLRYAPQGVARDGWHEISVTTPKYSYDLRARRGYLIESAKSPSVLADAAPSASSADALVAGGDAGNYDAVGKVIAANPTAASRLDLINAFLARGNVFPTAPRREFVIGLQLAESALPSTSPILRPAGYALLKKHANLLPQVDGDDGFERYWRAAAVALAEATVHPAQWGTQLVTESLAKFPDEPRFVLAAAIVADQEWIAGDITSPAAPKGRTAEIVRRFDAAIALEPTRAEASIRKGWFLNRMGRGAEALTLVEEARPDPNDKVLGYWRELFRGKILDGLGRPAEAAAAFRSALTIVPNAQSARVGLMAVLVRAGATGEAQQIAESLQESPVAGVDPWWIYWQADYRWFPTLLSRLAAFAK